MKKIKIGLLGLGTVASGLVNAINKHAALLADRNGFELSIQRIAVRNTNAKRNCEVNSALLTSDALSVVNDPEVDIVVELIGGVDFAGELISLALQNGKAVVSANKALIAARGKELFALAAENNTALFFEAAVAGAIPIIKTLRESFAGNEIHSISGILNGTCNYILTSMQEENKSFSVALQEATDLGYAEADPSLDIDGDDTAQKISILGSLASGAWLSPDDMKVDGIRHISLDDINFAKDLGYSIKLLGSYQLNESGAVHLSTQCTLVPDNSMLANVKGAFNAARLGGDLLGPAMLYGQGAGEKPTASAVFADLIEAASKNLKGTLGEDQKMIYKDAPQFISEEEISSEFYLRIMLEDCPSVFGKIATLLGRHGVSMASVSQKRNAEKQVLPVIVLTHEVSLNSMNTALAEIAELSFVSEAPVLYPVMNC